ARAGRSSNVLLDEVDPMLALELGPRVAVLGDEPVLADLEQRDAVDRRRLATIGWPDDRAVLDGRPAVGADDRLAEGEAGAGFLVERARRVGEGRRAAVLEVAEGPGAEATIGCVASRDPGRAGAHP